MAFDPLKQPLGMLRESAESRSILHARSIKFRLSKPFAAPAKIDHRPWRAAHVESQESTNSCVGHGQTSGGEVIWYTDTKGEQLKFNRKAGYRWSQLEDGISGDNGAMISGAVKAARRRGFALESLWPFDGKYSATVPQKVVDDGKKRLLLGSTAVLRSYQECFDWLAAGVGVILFGTPWYSSFAETRGVINQAKGQVLGMHCTVCHGYSERKDSQGRNYLIGENSHSKQYGDRGFMEWAPAIVEWFCQNIKKGNEMMGMTKIVPDKPDDPIDPQETEWINKAFG